MLPQTIAILSSDRKKSRKFWPMFAGQASLSSWVLIFYNSKEFPDWVGCWLSLSLITLSGSLSALFSGLFLQRQMSPWWCLALMVGPEQ